MLRTKPSCIIYVKKGPLSHEYVIYFDNIFILITKGPLQYGQNLRFVIKIFLHFTQIYRKNRSCVFVGINFISPPSKNNILSKSHLLRKSLILSKEFYKYAYTRKRDKKFTNLRYFWLNCALFFLHIPNNYLR